MGEKAKERSTIFYITKMRVQQNLLQVVVEIIVGQNGNIHGTKLKMMSNQISELVFLSFFFLRFPKSPSSWKHWLHDMLDTGEKGGANKFVVDNALGLWVLF